MWRGGHDITKNFRYLKWRNPEPYKAVVRVGIPLDLATDNEKRSSFVEVSNHQEFQVPKVQVLNLKKLFWGVGFPLHKPYPYSLYSGEDSSILGTNEMFGDDIHSLKLTVPT